MFLFLYKSLRMVISAVRGSDSPVQIGMGVALGMLIGLIPKDSLLAYVVGLFVFATSVNLLATAITAFTFTWIGAFLDPVSHQLGFYLLTHPALETFWIWLYELPAMPWTRFNNTVVLGSFLIGLLMLYPAFYLSKTYFEKYSPHVSKSLTRFWIYRCLIGKKKLARLAGADE